MDTVTPLRTLGLSGLWLHQEKNRSTLA